MYVFSIASAILNHNLNEQSLLIEPNLCLLCHTAELLFASVFALSKYILVRISLVSPFSGKKRTHTNAADNIGDRTRHNFC